MDRILGGLCAAALVLVAVPAFAQMTLPGKFEVTDTGSASYTIPISVVPGTAGLEPKLSLQYDSRSGNGLLGVGWSLSGLPAITRCGRTIAQDGAMGGVAYDVNDRFCLDGQRLNAVTGTYGADQTEYRTERESFSKIVSYGSAGSGPAWFKVWTKAGLVMEFGNTADSRIEAQGRAEARVWTLSKTSDTKGNYFSVSYSEDNANGSYQPSRIDYTGNDGAAPTNSVRFAYELRPDIALLYSGGALIRQDKRLTKIEGFQGEVLSGELRLTYGVSTTQRSILLETKRCDPAGSCLPATQYQWVSGDVPDFLANTSWSAGGNWNYWNPTWGDFNGDGRMDMMAYYIGDGWRETPALATGTGQFAQAGGFSFGGSWSGWSPTWGDFNGDGRTDAMAYYIGSGGWQTNVALAQPNGGFSAAVSWSAGGNWNYWNPAWGDFNGDGRMDMIAYYIGGDGWRASTALATGTGQFAQSGGFSFGGNWNGWSPSWGDFNGDGRMDMMAYYIGSGGWQTNVALSRADNTFSSAVGWSTGGNWSGWNLAWGDFNGDGHMDMIAYKIGSSGWYTNIALAKGDGTFAAPIAWSDTANWNYWTVAFGDFNGDNRTDMIAYYIGSDGWRGNTALATQDGQFIRAGSFSYGGNWSGWSPSFGDYTGDGRTDAMAYYIGSGGWQSNVVPTAPKQLLVSRIQNSGAATTDVTHKPISQPDAQYGADTDAVYPAVDIRGPLYVVSEVKSSNGLGITGAGGEYRSSYRYVGAKADSHGRGFLGFRQMTVRDEQTGVEQVTSYRQDYPFTGLVASREKKLGAQLLNRSTNSYSSTDLGGTRRYPFLTQSLEESWELSGQALPAVTTSYQYDAFGNATQVGVSTGDGHTKVTTNTYSNDTANWLLGRLTRSEVTSTTPEN